MGGRGAFSGGKLLKYGWGTIGHIGDVKKLEKLEGSNNKLPEYSSCPNIQEVQTRNIPALLKRASLGNCGLIMRIESQYSISSMDIIKINLAFMSIILIETRATKEKKLNSLSPATRSMNSIKKF